jgi:hypothetical protein
VPGGGLGGLALSTLLRPHAAEAARQDVRLIGENLTRSALDLEGRIEDAHQDGPDLHCRRLLLTTLKPRDAVTFNPGNSHVMVWIGDRYFVEGIAREDDFPDVTLARNGTISRQDCYQPGSWISIDKPRNMGQKITKTVGSVQNEVERQHDLYGDIVFRVRIRS